MKKTLNNAEVYTNLASAILSAGCLEHLDGYITLYGLDNINRMLNYAREYYYSEIDVKENIKAAIKLHHLRQEYGA